MNPPNVVSGLSSHSSPSSQASFTFPDLAVTNLADAISILDESIGVAEKAVESIVGFLSLTDKQVDGVDLAVCPFNFHHRMPPESLFRHWLVCPSSPGIVDLSILDCLCYPRSLEAVPEKTKFEPLQDLEVELCFSFDRFGVFGSSFYYKDCPGVVSSANRENTFSLPGILAAECANFMPMSDQNFKCLSVLPSELCVLKNEVDSWTDYPFSCSDIILRGFSCLRVVEKKFITSWIVRNSPCYGIVIDDLIGGHIYILLELCLKVISSEAFEALDSVLESSTPLKPNQNNLKCKHLIQILSWLSSQMSILYGERNGKLLVISTLKQCLLKSASNCMMFSSKENQNKLNDGVCIDQKGDIEGTVTPPSCFDMIFMSQVAAAISALHERAQLEGSITYIRFGRNLPRMQMMAECAHISRVAEEERKNRMDYRPVLELDGFLWQRSQNQDSSKNKTREELLAEERDYKRRRMSYRGKKAKRSTTEVIRDIIEEQMEEIKNAGGIGCFIRGPTDAGNFPQGSISSSDLYVVKNRMRESSCDLSETNRKHSIPSGKKHFSDDHRDFEQHSANRSNVSYHKHSKHRRSRSPHSSRNRHSSREKYVHKRDSYHLEEQYRHEREDSTSSYRSKPLRTDRREHRSERSPANKERYGSRVSRHESKPFDDRYDPSSTCEKRSGTN